MQVREMNTAFERSEQKDEWLTPPHIFEPLQPFDIDVCQPIKPPFLIAPRGFNVNDDGLAQIWGGGSFGAILHTEERLQNGSSE